MKSRSMVVFAVAALLALVAGCSFLEDNGTHLAYALEKGAKKLRSSPAAELVVRYETLDGPAEPYYVEITPSFGDAVQIDARWSSYLVVSGKTSGGTGYHNRFLFVPERLFIRKDRGGVTEVVLQKSGDQIRAVALR